MMNESTHDNRMRRLFDVIERDPGSLVRHAYTRYQALDVRRFGAWLERQGWTRHDGRALAEYARYTTDAGQLIILIALSYDWGSVLVQGKHAEDTHRFLAPLVKRVEAGSDRPI